MQPERPSHAPEHVERCFDALVSAGLAETISVGGALGLLCYLDYRPTHDVDAWWQSETTPAERSRVVATVQRTLEPLGPVRVRTWGEVVSIELLRGRKKVFSFQIAERSALLEAPGPAPWPSMLLDSFADLLANKMAALVERGAPRDFRDVYAVCQAGLTSPGECWRLWLERQRRANASAEAHRARLAVETHLARIVQHRPLDRIADPGERAIAERARKWYEEELLDALVD